MTTKARRLGIDRFQLALTLFVLIPWQESRLPAPLDPSEQALRALIVKSSLGKGQFDERFHPGYFARILADLSALGDVRVRGFFRKLPWDSALKEEGFFASNVVGALSMALYRGDRPPEYLGYGIDESVYSDVWRVFSGYPLDIQGGVPFYLGMLPARLNEIAHPGPGTYMFSRLEDWLLWASRSRFVERDYPPMENPLTAAADVLNSIEQLLEHFNIHHGPFEEDRIVAIRESLSVQIRSQALNCLGEKLRLLIVVPADPLKIADDGVWAAIVAEVHVQECSWDDEGFYELVE